MKERWVIIPGLEKYEANIVFPFGVRNATTGHIMKPQTIRNIYYLYDGSGERAIRRPLLRLVFCAKNGVRIQDLPGTACILLEGNTPVLYSRSSISSEIAKRVNAERHKKRDPSELYKEAIRFSEMVIEAFKKEDFKPVTDYLFRTAYKPTVDYLQFNTKYRLSRNYAEELAADAIEAVTRVIQNGSVIAVVDSYVRKNALAIYNRERAYRRRLVGIDVSKASKYL